MAETQRICKTVVDDWTMPSDMSLSAKSEQAGSGGRPRKTSTLSVALETIAMLQTSCNQKAERVHQLRGRMRDIKDSMYNALQGV
jgi:hypothetical protein